MNHRQFQLSAGHAHLDKQHELGQFLTPNPVAEFKASLFEIPRSEVHLLDAGAGAGSSRRTSLLV